jgi:hypothetical protein
MCDLRVLLVGNYYDMNLSLSKLSGCKWSMQYEEHQCTSWLSPLNTSVQALLVARK